MTSVQYWLTGCTQVKWALRKRNKNRKRQWAEDNTWNSLLNGWWPNQWMTNRSCAAHESLDWLNNSAIKKEPWELASVTKIGSCALEYWWPPRHGVVLLRLYIVCEVPSVQRWNCWLACPLTVAHVRWKNAKRRMGNLLTQKEAKSLPWMIGDNQF